MKTPEEMTDAELNEAVAVEVCGHWFFSYNGRCYPEKPYELLNANALQGGWNLPPYATSADAVLPLLEKANFRIERLRLPLAYIIYIELPKATYVKAEDRTLPRAACIALLKAARAEKEGK